MRGFAKRQTLSYRPTASLIQQMVLSGWTRTVVEDGLLLVFTQELLGVDCLRRRGPERCAGLLLDGNRARMLQHEQTARKHCQSANWAATPLQPTIVGTHMRIRHDIQPNIHMALELARWQEATVTTPSHAAPDGTRPFTCA